MGCDDLFVLAKSLKFELEENYLFTAVSLLQGPQCLFPERCFPNVDTKNVTCPLVAFIVLVLS